MYNFYTLNPDHNSSRSTSTGITLDINQPLHNSTFYQLFADCYYDNASEEKQDLLAQHINSIDYLIAFLPSDTTDISNSNTITIYSNDDLNLLISTTDEREVYLPIFTDSIALKKFTDEPVFTLRVPAKWLWEFVLSQKNFNGVVFNPANIGWDISLQHVESLLTDINNA